MDYREMHQIAQDASRVRITAQTILAIVGDSLSEKSHDFLNTMSAYDGAKPLSIRQKEALYALRERSTRSSRISGYKVSTLVQRAFELRVELADDDDVEWLAKLREHGANVLVSKNEARRLIVICKSLEILPADEWINI